MAYIQKKIAAVFIFEKEGKFLFQKRTHTGHQDGWYMFPGGHIDTGETITDGAIREIKEELNIDVNPDDLEFKLVENAENHIVFFFKVSHHTGTIHNNEPEKHAELDFLPLSHPEIHPTVTREVNAIQNGITFIEVTE